MWYYRKKVSVFCSVRRKRRRNERTAANIITNMLRKGKSPEEIADLTGEELEEILEAEAAMPGLAALEAEAAENVEKIYIRMGDDELL